MIETNSLLSRLHIEQLTPMQTAVGEAYREPKDLVLLSPTGSGKTLAFLLPLIQSLRADIAGVQALILVPSRELALQTEQVFRQTGTPFRAMSCYGGRAAMEEHRTMQGTHPQVIIGTPGRINDHLQKQNFDAHTVSTLVIDEFDKSLELGFQEEMEEIIGRLPSLGKRVLLSATDAAEIPRFTGVGALNAVVKLDFTEPASLTSRLTLYRVDSPDKDKLETLYRLLCVISNEYPEAAGNACSTLVFCNYRESVERVTGYLQAKRFPCDMFHGGMEQPDRERALYKFRNGSCPVLVSTDLAARGLDIPGVAHIVHYHLPVNEEAFTHRNGRTARWTATGNSYLLMHHEEALPAYLSDAPSPFLLPEIVPAPAKPHWTTLYIGKGKKDKLNKIDIVGFLYKKGALSADDIGQVDVKDRYAFVAVRRNKARQLLTLIRNEKIKGMKTVFEEAK
ncbi:MAG: DEAD/DEAH box helicase [Prevotellaceae bacterium]|nr:DEAD/DEAH box helicase [Prevotellaceae bacterium]